MRGVPNNPVICTKCGSQNGAPKDQLCHRCRLQGRGNPRKKFYWTPELDLALTRAYRSARDRQELTTLLNHVQRVSRFPRFVIVARAAHLGLCFQVRRRWTESEVETLRELLGRQSQSAVARQLGRTYQSVKWKIAKLRLSSRIREGYTLADIQELLGVNSRKMYGWIQRGWLRMDNGRVSERDIKRFLLRYPQEYMLRKVDEAWFKDIVFSQRQAPYNSEPAIPGLSEAGAEASIT